MSTAVMDDHTAQDESSPLERAVSPLTDTDHRVISAWKAWIAEHGMPPTLRELRNKLALSDPTLHTALMKWHLMGKCEHHPAEARAFRPLRRKET